MEPLTFTCPSCDLLLSYERGQGGGPFQCPGCGLRGTLPAAPPLPVAEELLTGKGPTQAERRKQTRAWRQVHRGLTVLLGAWLILLGLATFLMIGLAYECLHIVLGFAGPPLPLAVPGVIGILMVGVEFAALRGYWLCLGAPEEERLRDWVWVAMGMAVVRNCACLGVSVLYFLPAAVGDKMLFLSTVLAAGLFAGQLFLASLMLRAIAYAQKAHWIMRMVWNSVYILSATVLGWAFLSCLVFMAAGSSEEGGQVTAALASFVVRLLVGCGGLVLLVGLWLCLLWHLRVLYYLRNMIEA